MHSWLRIHARAYMHACYLSSQCATLLFTYIASARSIAWNKLGDSLCEAVCMFLVPYTVQDDRHRVKGSSVKGDTFSHIQGITLQDKTEPVIFSDLQVSDSQADSRLLSTKTARYCSSVTNRQSFNTVQKDGDLGARQDNSRADSAD